MKREQKQLLNFLEVMVVCLIFASLYAIGGSEDFGGQKWVRRFLAPGLFGIWAFWRSGDWRTIVQTPLMMGALTLPYGADIFLQKVWLRSLFGITNAIGSSFYAFFNGRFALVVIHILLNITASVGFGVWNPFIGDAMKEQAAIGLIIILIPACSIIRRNEP